MKSKIDKPFNVSILHKAEKIASQYRIILEKNEKLGYIGSSVELPGVFVDAKTPEKCYKAVEEALTIAIATMVENGQTPPLPSSENKRTFQVNVRLTSDEKLLISNAANSSDFKGISDFIRSTALKSVFSH
jgi:predicted RNase H-like HicB family nuclease